MVLGIFALGCAILAYCLWTGKVGDRFGGVSTRSDDPFFYWLKIALLVWLTYLMYKAAFHHLSA